MWQKTLYKTSQTDFDINTHALIEGKTLIYYHLQGQQWDGAEMGLKQKHLAHSSTGWCDPAPVVPRAVTCASTRDLKHTHLALVMQCCVLWIHIPEPDWLVRVMMESCFLSFLFPKECRKAVAELGFKPTTWTHLVNWTPWFKKGSALKGAGFVSGVTGDVLSGNVAETFRISITPVQTCKNAWYQNETCLSDSWVSGGSATPTLTHLRLFSPAARWQCCSFRELNPKKWFISQQSFQPLAMCVCVCAVVVLWSHAV